MHVFRIQKALSGCRKRFWLHARLASTSQTLAESIEDQLFVFGQTCDSTFVKFLEDFIRLTFFVRFHFLFDHFASVLLLRPPKSADGCLSPATV